MPCPLPTTGSPPSNTKLQHFVIMYVNNIKCECIQPSAKAGCHLQWCSASLRARTPTSLLILWQTLYSTVLQYLEILCVILFAIFVQYSVPKPPWCTDILILWQTLHYSVSLYCDPSSSPTIALNLAAPAAPGLQERGSSPSKRQGLLPLSIRRNLKKDSKKASHWQPDGGSSPSVSGIVAPCRPENKSGAHSDIGYHCLRTALTSLTLMLCMLTSET